MMTENEHTTSQKSPKPNLSLTTSDGGSSMLFQEGIDITPDTTSPSVQDVVTIQGLAVEAPEVKHDTAPINAAETDIGVVPACADGELDPGLPHDGKRRDDLLSGAQHDVRGGWKPAGLGPGNELEHGEQGGQKVWGGDTMASPAQLQTSPWSLES